MSDPYFRRLQWVLPDVSDGADSAAAQTASVVAAAAEQTVQDKEKARKRAGIAWVERILQTVGLPTGSTEEARSSPLLEARDLLRAASEIEHGLLVQYLYAAYSCTKLTLRRTITQIAKEEMGHLISVQNMLLALGGHPYFGRDEFPIAPDSGEVFPFALTFEPLGLASLAKYVVAESPPLENITDAPLKARVAPIIDVGKGAAMQAINHVGALYIALYWLFKKDDTPPTEAEWKGPYPTDMVLRIHKKLNRKDWHVDKEAFAPRSDIEDLQADNDKEDWNRGDEAIFVRAVQFGANGEVDRIPILAALADIAEQGEGWQPPDPVKKSHFLRFLETFEALKAIQDSGSALPVLPVPTNTTTVAPAAPAPAPDSFIGNTEANLWARIFNVRYRIALLKLALVVASRRSLDGKTPDGRAALISGALVEMMVNLKTLALAVVQMRRTGVPADGPQAKRAAPPFELPKGSLPNLVGLDPDPKVAASKAVAALRQALKDAIAETGNLVKNVTDLPLDLLDTPAPRNFLTDVLVPADQDLLKALG